MPFQERPETNGAINGSCLIFLFISCTYITKLVDFVAEENKKY